MSDFAKEMKTFYLNRDNELEDQEINTTVDLTEYGNAYERIWELFFYGDIKPTDKEMAKDIAQKLCWIVDMLLPYNMYDNEDTEKAEDYFLNMKSQLYKIIDNLYE